MPATSTPPPSRPAPPMPLPSLFDDRRHPLRFNLLNNRQEASLLLTDDPKEDTDLHLSIFADGKTDIAFAPGATLTLRFRSGLLANLDEMKVACPSGWTWDKKQRLLISVPGATLTAGDSISFKLTGLKLASRVQQHSTRVELKYDGLRIGDRSRSGVCLVHMAIVHHVGNQRLPLRACVLGSRTILNDNRTANKFVLRLTNTDAATLDLHGGRILFRFAADPSVGTDWALGTKDQLGAIRCIAPGGREINPDKAGLAPVWTSPMSQKLPPGEWLDFDFENIVTSHVAGDTDLVVTTEDIPDYCDGEFAVALRKAPLLYAGTNVGIGTVSPGCPLSLGATIPGLPKLAVYENGTDLYGLGVQPGALTVWAGGGETARFTSGGRLGIGIAPTARLHVVENPADEGSIKPTAVIRAHNCGAMCSQPEPTQALSLQNGNPTAGNTVGIGFADANANELPSAWIGATLADKASHRGTLAFHTRGDDGLQPRMTIDMAGNVQIGENRVLGITTNDHFVHEEKSMGHYSIGWFKDSWFTYGDTAWISGYGGIKFFANGSPQLTIDYHGNVRYAASLEKFSTREIKENIAEYPGREALEVLEGLQPVRYSLIADADKREHLGFIAEDVPKAVACRDGKAISTDNILAVLAGVVKEQQRMIRALEDKLDALSKGGNPR